MSVPGSGWRVACQSRRRWQVLAGAALCTQVAVACAPRGREAPATASRAPALWGGLTPGPRPVGYVRLVAPGGIVHAWYPAVTQGDSVRVSDYLGRAAPATAKLLAGAGASPGAIDSLFATALYATREPRPLPQAGPLVLVAQGTGEDAFDQAVLCEYLASRGYVVASTPSPTLRTPLEREDQVGTMAELQASDLSAAITAVAEALSVDTLHLGVVGHSLGARGALLLAMRNASVRAIVSLDGGIGTATAIAPMRAAPSFRESASLPPLLHFSERLDDFMAPDTIFLATLHLAQLTIVPTREMHHVHFTTYGFVAARLPALAMATRATAGTTDEATAVVERTAHFLERWIPVPQS